MNPSNHSRLLFSVVLCPVDFSSHSRAALQYAAAVARRSRGELVALFVSDPLLVEAAAAAAYDKRRLAGMSERELRRFVRRAIGTSVNHIGGLTCRVELGKPSSEIAKVARLTGSNLIALGTQGLSGASQVLFGSTTERVLRHAAVPVLAVPPQARTPVGAGWPGKTVMAAVDLGTAATQDARRAAALADWFKARLSLVHVVPATQAPRWLSARVRAHNRTRLTRARAQMTRMSTALGARHDVAAHVVVGRPAEQIPAMAEDAGAGLVIVTLRKRGGWFGAAQGSITYHVLSGVTVPVLALPPSWRSPGT